MHLQIVQGVIQTTIHNLHYIVHSSSVANGVADQIGALVGGSAPLVRPLPQ